VFQKYVSSVLFFLAYWKIEDLSAVICFWSVLHGGNMKGDSGWDGLDGRRGANVIVG